MEQIVDPLCFDETSDKAFSSDEALLLICSSYAHDLGMAIFPNEEEELIQKLNISKEADWKTNQVLQKHLRAHHSERGGKYVDANYKSLQIPKNLTYLLHQLMRAHNLSISDLDNQFNERVAGDEKEINLKQLACILCIADSLEFSETRVVEGVLKTLEEKLKNNPDKAAIVSYEENMKHVCIGNSVAVGKDGKIIFSGTFDDPEILSLAHKTIDYIEDWLKGYTDIDYRSQSKRLKVRGDSIVRSLKIFGCDFERLGIRIKKDNVIDLISSNSVWSSDKAIILRELLQNSVEACRYRKHHSFHSHNYNPEICVICDKTTGTITIKDNGCGMSRNIVLNNFLTIGNSRSFDPEYTTEKYTSLARFGIGFWSVFTIAEHAKIQTAPFEYLKHSDSVNHSIDGLLFEVSINEAKDYTIFSQIQMNAGTIITLKLKENASIDDILDRLSYHIACSEIPIKINNGEDVYEIPIERNLPSYNDIFGARSKMAKDLGIEEYVYESKVEDIDFKMKLLYRKSQAEPTFFYQTIIDQSGILMIHSH
jgi:hypothetical protein